MRARGRAGRHVRRVGGHLLSAGLLALAMHGAVAAQAAAAPAPATTAARFENAIAHYESGRYQQAFALLAELADGGHCEAARIARQMAARGRTLYPMDFALTPERVTRWPPTARCTVAQGH